MFFSPASHRMPTSYRIVFVEPNEALVVPAILPVEASSTPPPLHVFKDGAVQLHDAPDWCSTTWCTGLVQYKYIHRIRRTDKHTHTRVTPFHQMSLLETFFNSYSCQSVSAQTVAMEIEDCGCDGNQMLWVCILRPPVVQSMETGARSWKIENKNVICWNAVCWKDLTFMCSYHNCWAIKAWSHWEKWPQISNIALGVDFTQREHSFRF